MVHMQSDCQMHSGRPKVDHSDETDFKALQGLCHLQTAVIAEEERAGLRELH